MLLPYYIASMNIEHEYMEQTGQYKPFEGICLTDTFELAEPEQASLAFMSEENTARVKKQKESPIFVVIGNPPYNVGQVDENDNNKNRKHTTLDLRVSSTYAKASSASSVSKLNDTYVKAIRWATDRLGDEGIIAFVNNNSFLDQIAFDGVRKCLQAEFDSIYILDLGGNIRKNPHLSGTTHNVFGIQVGVSINLFIRTKERHRPAAIRYASTGRDLRKEDRLAFLDGVRDESGVTWAQLVPDRKNTWLTDDLAPDFESLMPMGTKETKGGETSDGALCRTYSLGANTNRDSWAYNFSRPALAQNIKRFIDSYNKEVDRWLRSHNASDQVDSFIESDPTKIKWCSKLKQFLQAGTIATYSDAVIRRSTYRPFTSAYLYFDDVVVHRRGRLPRLFPDVKSEKENQAIWFKTGSDWPAFALAVNCIPDLLPQGGSQCFPFYTYDEDGSNRRENINDWALEEFRKHYADATITKWDIFYYTYALLHSAEYRERYAANLKRELPRIPFAPNFRAFVEAGQRLAEFHVNYEQQPEYPLEQIWKPGSKLDMRVDKMRLGKDKASLIYNDSLILSSIPAEIFEYRLGNRSALEWVIDQYQVFTDKRSGITNDPNREDDPEYILRLIGQVIYVSLETVKIVKGLPKMQIDAKGTAHA
jgi:predicted helicase